MAGKPRNPRPGTLAGKIGERVELIRKAKGLKSAELAAAAGLGLGTIIRLESGKGSPTIATLAAVAKALGISLVKIVSYDTKELK